VWSTPATSAWAVLASTLVAAAGAAACLLWGPDSQDLAAATFRADLFADHGFAIWNNAWYSGHYLLSYSVLYPPLGALLGPRLVAALAVVAAAALFALLARRRFGAAALVPSLWFAAAVASWLLTGRVPFLLALPFGLGALLAADAERHWPAALLALLASLASPVAGLFVALAGAAIALAGAGRRGLALMIGALAPIAALNLAFPTGGVEPFVFSAFVAVPLLAALVLWLVPAEHRALRIGAVLYAGLAVLLFAVDNPLGGNVTRLGALFAGPVLALALWPRGRWVVIAVSIPLLYWQLVAPVRDARKAAGDESTERAFHEPLLAELERLGDADVFRVHVPPTKNRWEAVYVAREHPIARGWLRQLESDDFDLFTDGRLTPDAYREWLDEHAVGYVAVPDARRDYLAEDEVAVIDAGVPYLTEVWSSADWRLYRVAEPQPIGVEASAPDRFALEAARPGAHEPALNYNRWWRLDDRDGCVSEADGRTVVVAERPGTLEAGVGLSGSGC
jgi:hypothetical protein